MLVILGACQGKIQKEASPLVDLPKDTTTDIEVEPGSVGEMQPPAEATNLTLLGEAIGDVDNDSKNERIVVYDTGSPTEMGTEREIHIYRKSDNQWVLWQRIKGGILPSQHGGVMGDPFQEVSIENGCIVLYHMGGSRDKWAYTHRFRYQKDKWELIGVTVSYFSNCETWENFDYNLSTGKIVLTKGTEDCTNGETRTTTSTRELNHKMDILPLLNLFYPGANELTIPGEETLYYY